MSTWRTKDGRRIPVAEMEVDHLQATARWLLGRSWEHVVRRALERQGPYQDADWRTPVDVFAAAWEGGGDVLRRTAELGLIAEGGLFDPLEGDVKPS